MLKHVLRRNFFVALSCAILAKTYNCKLKRRIEEKPRIGEVGE